VLFYDRTNIFNITADNCKWLLIQT